MSHRYVCALFSNFINVKTGHILCTQITQAYQLTQDEVPVNSRAFNAQCDAKVNGSPQWLRRTTVTTMVIASYWPQHLGSAAAATNHHQYNNGHLTASFPGQPSKLAPERQTISGFNEAGDDGEGHLHQLNHAEIICTLLYTNMPAPVTWIFTRPDDAIPEHWRQ